jgi:hypothetical protein
MSRTATDQRKRRARSREDWSQPLVFTVFDLRHPRGQAPAAGRPAPREVRRRVRLEGYVSTWGVSTWGRGGLARVARQHERRARAATRDRLVRLRQLVNGPGGLAAAEELDVPPYRHRRSALWDAI